MGSTTRGSDVVGKKRAERWQKPLYAGDKLTTAEREVDHVIEDGWFVRNAGVLKTVFRVVFGVIWGVDGVLKFDPALVQAFPDMIAEAAQGQPAWLQGWFSFWQGATAAQPAFWVYGTGVVEEALAFALLFAQARNLPVDRVKGFRRMRCPRDPLGQRIPIGVLARRNCGCFRA